MIIVQMCADFPISKFVGTDFTPSGGYLLLLYYSMASIIIGMAVTG